MINKAINMIFAFGAAIVIFGAWQKITHKPFADLSLTVGLITEVILFCIMGIQELFKKPETLNSPVVGTSSVDHSELTNSVNNLNQTIKKVFNQ